MPNVHQKTEAITAAQLTALSEALRRMSEILASAATAADSQPQGHLAIYNWPSAQAGLKRLRPFVNDAEEAATLAQLGTPRDVGQRKPRSVGGPSSGREMTDEEIAQSQQEVREWLKTPKKTKAVKASKTAKASKKKS